MAEETGATAASGPAAGGEGKMTMVVGVDESEHSYYALQWTLLHFFSPGQQQQYRLVVVTAKPTAASAVGLAGPGAADVLPFVEADLKRSSLRVIDKASRRDVGCGQPWLWSNQKGCSWKCERLLHPPRALHRDGCEETKAQALSNAQP
ncbi:unnamed protein product [Triticum turgidum subsp. durum]|uniref:UspA domain-containing protein n=1 Tax=Triticum turgidum subsp. durum TaxID=4567 RepID=A0A9R0TIJ5_TRITD|nr:unnamed protein product [Triticum turgidum subsp. durum]